MMDVEVVRWVTANAEDLVACAPMELRTGDGYRVSVVHRSGRHQVELVELEPHTSVPSHRHPCIDSVELYQGGDFVLIVGVHRFHAHPGLKPHRRLIPIRAIDWHAAEVGVAGARFLSIQEWDRFTPITSVLEDWDGQRERVVCDANH